MKHSQFTLDLIAWSAQHWPEPIDAMNGTDADYEWRCIGAIFRRRAQLDPRWFWRIVDEQPAELMELSPYIGNIEVSGATFPPPMGWKAWLDAVELASGPWFRACECVEPVAETPSTPPDAVKVSERGGNRRESGSGLFGEAA